MSTSKKDTPVPQGETAVQTDAAAPKKVSRMTFKGYLALLVFVMICDFVLVLIYNNVDNQAILTAIPFALLIFNLIIAPVMIIYTIKYLFKGIRLLTKLLFSWLKKKPLVFIRTFAGVIVILVLVIFIVRRTQFARDQYYLDLIQDHMASAAYLKSIGDSIVILNKPVPEGWNSEKVHNTDWEIQDSLFKFHRAVAGTKVEEYFYSAFTWLFDIDNGTTDKETWKTVSATPPEFAISLNDNDLNAAIEKSFTRIMNLKEFSDLAVANNDKEAMRYVAARLLVQVSWLENLAVSDDAGFWADGQLNIFPVAKALGVRPFRPCNGFLGCTQLPQTRRLAQGVWQSAHNYSVGEASAETVTNSWSEMELGIKDSGYPITGAGLQVGPDTKTMISPRLEQFSNECHAKGGIVGGTGGVMTHLPTTESGYPCWYDNNNKCWDLLTYSGGRYKGGEGNCERQNLVPDPNFFDNFAEGVENIQYDLNDSLANLGDDLANIISNKWDGTYNIEFSGAACSGLPKVQGFDPNTYLASYLHTYSTLQVSGNNVSGLQNGWINESGNASPDISVAGGGMNVYLRMDLQFLESAPAKTVTGVMYFSTSGTGADVACSVSMSGTKAN